MSGSAWFWATVAFICWHVGLIKIFRIILTVRMAQAWQVGHKLGRISGMMSPDQMKKWLADQGIDADMLPPLK